MILDNILEKKLEEIRKRKEDSPLDSFQHQLGKPARSFRKALCTKGKTVIIAELKKASPSEGIIRKDFNPVALAKAYEKAGAKALSVLTDWPFFQGSLHDLEKVKEAVSLPLLQKDFIIDPYQVYEAKRHGADAILLIARILPTIDIRRFLAVAAELGMDALVEVHNEEELKRALDAHAVIIGINNRGLDTLKTDLRTTERLLKKIPNGTLTGCESGIVTREDFEEVKGRVSAALIGTAFMKSSDIFKKFQELTGNA